MKKTLLIVVASIALFASCTNSSKTEDQTSTTDSTVVVADSVATDTIVAK